jgi:hypothetical protein
MKFAGPFEAANLSSMLEASRIVDSKDGLSLEEKEKEKKTKDKDSRKSNIANLTADYENELKNYNQDKIYDTINDISGIEINRVKKFHKLLKEYIEDLKYKNIIFNKE